MKVTILYTGVPSDDVRQGMDIARHFAPENSYIDSDAYVNGHKCEAACGSAAAGNAVAAGSFAYGKSVYATNVEGMGMSKGLLPLFSSPVKLAYFERAKMTAAEAKANGTTDAGVTVTVADDAAEKLWWEQIGAALKGAGFDVTMTSDNS